MKVVEFDRHNAPFVAGERAAFDALTAERFEKRGTGRVVGTVDDKGAVLAEGLAGDPPGGEEGPEGAAAPPTRGPRGSRQA